MIASERQALPFATEPLEFWESGETRPSIPATSAEVRAELEQHCARYLIPCLRHPYLPRETIRRAQLGRLRSLVELAYRDIPVYREKYRAAGITPADVRSFEDFEQLPIVTKQELIASFPDRCVNPRYRPDELFSTRSSGSSGQTLLIKVDKRAILMDTVQGIRQFLLQTGLRYRPDHLIAHVYTVPWYFLSVGAHFLSAFISSLMAPERIIEILEDIRPQVISCYPTNLKTLLPELENARAATANLSLAVVHSEQSSQMERAAWSRRLGVPVLDEYSSEESTRIALELPCGHYHVCDDTVYVEALDPITRRPQMPGTPGLAVITNLLNEAMPFIRYAQGDYVTLPASPAPCMIQWSQLSSVDGRANDSFLTADGREIPAGTVLDVTYRWMYDTGVHIQTFELVQRAPDCVAATFVPHERVDNGALRRSIEHLEALLAACTGHPVRVLVSVVTHLPSGNGKRRPIRREFPRQPS